MTTDPSPDPALNVLQAAAELGISEAAFWRAVASGRLPAPFYPSTTAPRWWRSELRASVEQTRMKPAEAKAARRNAKLRADREQAAA